MSNQVLSGGLIYSGGGDNAHQVLAGGVIGRFVSGGTPGNAPGATLTAAATLVAGSAEGSAEGTASGVTLTAAASLVAGSATGDAAAAGATLTSAATLVAGSANGVIAGTLQFQAAGMEFGGRTGLEIDSVSLDAEVDFRYEVFANALTLGSPIYTSGVLTTDTAGKLPNFQNEIFVQGTTYRVHAIRQSDGEAATFRMVAA